MFTALSHRNPPKSFAKCRTPVPKRASSTVSKAAPWRELIKRWMDAGVEGVAIHAALVRLPAFLNLLS